MPGSTDWEQFHKITVTYYQDDDGIWLRCDGCGWTVSAGFFPTVEELVQAEKDHRPLVIE